MKNPVIARRDFVLLAACMVSTVGGRFAWAAAEDPPFAIDRRPAPTGEDLNVLLPAVLGPFRRDPLPAGAKLMSDEDINVTYRDGKDSANVGLSKPESVDDAREAIKVSRDEAIASKLSLRDERFSLKTEPAYFHVGDFIAWNRGRYFFYVKANNAATLSRFMTLYPF